MKGNEQSLQEIWDYVKGPMPDAYLEECIQAGKHPSGYYPGELCQTSKAGKHSNIGNTENTTRILL